MQKKFLLLFVMLFVFSAPAFARNHEKYYVRDEAARRNLNLITIEQAKEIAAKQINSGNVRFKEIELEDEHEDYYNGSNFRPVYDIECVSGFTEYDMKIDAVTGEILKFKIDD